MNTSGLRWNTVTAPLLVCLCLSCASPQPQTTSVETGSKPLRQMVIGLCEDYPEESRSLTNARRDLQVLATNDIHVLRIAFGWDAMEPEPGKYDWSYWDEFVRMAVDEHRIRLIPYICYTPRWASTSNKDDFWQHPPKDTERFAAFVKQLVNRYKDRIHSWEIWNEPDNPAYWAGTPEQFAELLGTGSRAVREADPKAKVVFGGLAWNLSFLQDVLNVSNSVANVDVINLHNYFETWSSDPLENLPDYVGRANDILRQNGLEKPIWMAEVGYSSYRSNNFVSAQYDAYFGEEHTDEFQADVLFRVLTLLAASEKVPLAAWYRVNDLPSSQEVIGDVNNRHLGVLDEHGNPKPSLQSLRHFQSLFRSGFRNIDNEVRITKQVGAPVIAHSFQLANGSTILVAWLKNYVPGTREDAAQRRTDTRQAEVSFTLPSPSGRAAALYDERGRRIAGLPLRHGASGSELKLRIQGAATCVVIVSR